MTTTTLKLAFALFVNDGEKKDETTFKPFEKDPVTADYRILGLGDEETNKSIRGSAIKDKSQAGNPVIRVNFGVKIDGKTTYFSGALNKSKLEPKEGKEPPVLFGTIKSKDGTELDVGAWAKKDKNGKGYYACEANPPYEKASATSDAEPATATTADDDFPL